MTRVELPSASNLVSGGPGPSKGHFPTRDWGPVTIALQALSLVEKAELVNVRFTLRLRDQRSMRMQDGCKVCMASNGSCFMITWTIFKNHLLEVGRTQNGRPWRSECSPPSIYSIFIMIEDPHEQEFIEIGFARGSGHVWLHTTLEGPWPHYMIWEVCWDSPLDTFFWALTTSWSRLLARAWSRPNF